MLFRNDNRHVKHSCICLFKIKKFFLRPHIKILFFQGLTVDQGELATEFFKMNKNCCLNELKSTAYINEYANEINVRVYIHALSTYMNIYGLPLSIQMLLL